MEIIKMILSYVCAVSVVYCLTKMFLYLLGKPKKQTKIPDFKLYISPPSPPTETTNGKMIVRYKIKE